MKDKKLQMQLDQIEKKLKVSKQNVVLDADKKLLEVNQKFIVLENNFNEVNNQLQTLKQKVDLLEEADPGGGSGGEVPANLALVATTGNYLDLHSRPDAHQSVTTSSDKTLTYFYQYNLDTTFKSQPLHFICSPDEVVEGVADIYAAISRNNFSCNENYELWLNDEIKLGVVNYTSLFVYPTLKQITFSFRPKKAENFFRIVGIHSGTHTNKLRLERLIINFSKGKNIYAPYRQNLKKIAAYQGKYILYSNEYSSCYARICDKDTFEGPLNIEHTTKFFGTRPQVAFVPLYTIPNAITIDTTKIAVTGCATNYNMNSILSASFEHLGTSTIINYEYPLTGATITYFRENISDYAKFPGIVAVNTTNRRLAFIQMRQYYENFTDYFEYQVNGEFVEDDWIENVGVISQDLNGISPIGFKGSVAVKKTGECVFFPHFNSTYCLPLGRGRNVHVYYNQNEDIDVYMAQIGFVIKKTLRKNAQGIYQIYKEKRIYGFDECIETTDGKILGVADNKFLLEDIRD